MLRGQYPSPLVPNCKRLDDWLSSSLPSMAINDQALSYLYKRGATDDAIRSLGITVWSPPSEECPPGFFDYRKFGSRLERMAGMLVCPIVSPRDRVVGIEARSYIGPKRIIDVRFAESKWNPSWIAEPGLPARMSDGSDVWIVEGLFDLLALRWAVKSPIISTMTAKVTRMHSAFFGRHSRGMVRIAYDMDASGRRGSVEALSLLSKYGVKAVAVKYSRKDPGEVWDDLGEEGLVNEFGR